MKRALLLSFSLAGLLGAAVLGGNGSGTTDHEPERDVLDVALAGGNGSGTTDHEPERDVLDLV
ncbi:MAG: hypothetical protein R3181_04680 [Rubricoccaceae bacterium]|nr:hypothetical protein [Rubricoccaceae bacterium]